MEGHKFIIFINVKCHPLEIKPLSLTLPSHHTCNGLHAGRDQYPRTALRAVGEGIKTTTKS